MKLRYLAALLMLFAIGCTQQPASDTTTAAPESDSSVSSTDTATSTTVESETETQLATVSFDVTGMK